MMRSTKLEDPFRVRVVHALKKKAGKEKAPLWAAVAERLSSSRKNRPQVNLRKIDSHTQDGDVVVVPGKVLGAGKLTKKVDVAAYLFTESAREGIESAGGRVLSLMELAEKNTRGSGVKIIV